MSRGFPTPRTGLAWFPWPAAGGPLGLAGPCVDAGVACEGGCGRRRVRHRRRRGERQRAVLRRRGERRIPGDPRCRLAEQAGGACDIAQRRRVCRGVRRPGRGQFADESGGGLAPFASAGGGLEEGGIGRRRIAWVDAGCGCPVERGPGCRFGDGGGESKPFGARGGAVETRCPSSGNKSVDGTPQGVGRGGHELGVPSGGGRQAAGLWASRR